ncbi:transmembrane protein 79-like [Stegastes partitus]|uniref:Transmembrane protein 79-like n=1 Tax=Stegastes partitus TaxID=144197 RepID=A0A3B5B867_9TELE|nr:PREDICTED: transmembrane protein 79-like [Stegastes partitus]XP_008296950.1 PREDICTED: transmembrane protein 79-like [Stegastes partitus]XP_008302716.1 PREDICTED: transmembrane protein 79-like [Stegastes partitus]XP_008302717.1 PREDICTED: transmembrane protein 79-like [Stegastes partitus]
MKDSGGMKQEEDEVVRTARMEPSTLQWPAHRETGGQTSKQTGNGDRMSVRSDMSLREASSWTESERELKAEGESRGLGKEAGLMGEGAGLKTHLEEEPEENHLPEKAAQVFSPAVTVLPSPSSPRDSEAFWEMGSEKSPFLGPQEPQDYNQHGYQYEWTEDTPHARCGQGCPSRDVLKVGVSLMTSAMLFPFLVWGGYVFLPFDAPLMDSAPLRLVYTLRCSVFAAAPIVLGWLVLGVSRLRSGGIRPLFDDELKEGELQQVEVHRRFVADSASLFLIYFLQLVVMAMYLSQEQLKLVPLLTIVFAFGRLVYWVAAAFGSSVRGFGFGLSFLPSLAMMVANFYFIFTVEAASSIFSSASEELPAPPPGKQRFWG